MKNTDWLDENAYPEHLRDTAKIIVEHGLGLIGSGRFFTSLERLKVVTNIAERIYQLTKPPTPEKRHFVHICIDDRIPWMAMYVDGRLVLQGYTDEVPPELVMRTLRGAVGTYLCEHLIDGGIHEDAPMKEFDFRMSSMHLPATCPYLKSALMTKADTEVKDVE